VPALRQAVRTAQAGARLLLDRVPSKGRAKPHERVPVDQAAVARLFDSSRDPDERVRADEWFLGPPEFAALYAYDTVKQRRRWFRNLVAEGLIEGPAPR
jgi:hypothetical protein